jgi:NAD-dependent DNA ligase
MFIIVILVSLSVLFFAIGTIQKIREQRAEKAQQEYMENLRRIAAQDRYRQRREAAERKAATKARQERAAAERKAAQEKARQERAANVAARAEAQKARQLEKLETARQIAEYNERALKAARELRELEAAREAAPATDPAPASVRADAAPADLEASAERPETISKGNEGPRPFLGQVVSFTGKLSSMTRAEAIAAVKAAGGLAYKEMPAGTTLLVVGSNPGQKKQDLYDKWIGQVKKITEAQFMAMLKGV